MTSFLDFQPFLRGFQSVNEYLKDLARDINNPYYFQRIVSPFSNFQITSLSNESIIWKFLNPPACRVNPYGCKSKIKLEQYQLEIQYVIKVFHAIYKKFLTAINHIDYHPLQVQNTTQVKRSEEHNLYGHYHTHTQSLTPSEEDFLDEFLKALNKVHPSSHKSLTCMKRVGILTWILQWGVYSNARSISKIKDNLHTLQKQNQLQDKQIKHLAKFLNLTMHQVSRHSEMLFEMDTKMFIINKTLQDVMWLINVLRYESDVIHYFQSRMFRVHTSLYALRGDIESLYEHMRALASQELNPMIIPPDILKRILHKIEEDIKSNARLKLCKDPKTNIWSYYGTVKLTPIVLQDYLKLILTVPLVDPLLQMNLYKVHNLPMLHPTLNVHAQYELEGTYLVTMMESMFISLPRALDVKLCLVTNGHLCMFNQALYLVECTNWCIYALFINDKDKIKRDCFLKTLNQTINLAYSLDGHLWAISALAAEKLQVRCVMETHVKTIKPPLQIMDIGNGCEAYSACIYIPAKSELTATLQMITISQFILEYDFNYSNISNFLVWYKSDLTKLTKEEIETLKAKVLKLPTMSMEMFDNVLENIDENYNLSLSPTLILALLVSVGVCVIALGIIFIWYKRKTSLTCSTVENYLDMFLL